MGRLFRLKASVLLSGLTLLFFFGSPAATSSYRSDAQLRSQFFEHRTDFEKLVKMAQEDNHLVRIATEFTSLDTDASWPRKDIGISEQRWNEYRRLFRRAGVPDGIAKAIDPVKIFFPIAVEGLVPASQEKGIVYSPATLSPVLKTLDKRPPAELYDKSGHVIAFRPIEGHWYIYYEEW